MKQIKGGLYVLGIGALIFTVIFTVLNIRWTTQYGVVWWNIVLQWPMEWYHVFYRIFNGPLSLLHLPIVVYLRISIAILSPFMAFISARRLDYSSIGQILWPVMAFLFPFSLLVMATTPRGNIEHQPIFERLIGAAIRTLLTAAFVFGTLFVVVFVATSALTGRESEVWVPGFRGMLNSRNLAFLNDVNVTSDVFCLVLPGILIFIVFFIPIFREELKSPWWLLKEALHSRR